MIKRKSLITSMFLLVCSLSFSQGVWTTKASLGTATNSRSKGASFEIAGLGYIGTGYNGTAKNDLWRYDPATNAWTQMANFGGTARYGAIGFAVNGAGYIGTGFTSPTYAKDMWKYNVAGNSWSQVADFGGSGRMDATCFVIGNSVYAGTGYTGSNVLNDFWKYNPVSDTWTSKANYAGTICASATGFSLSGKGYICLGRNSTGSTCYNTLYQYDTTANTWTARTNFTGAAREGAAVFVIANEAYVGTGGSNNLGTLYNNFYKYDPVANAWSPIANFIGSLRSHTNSFSIGSSGYVGMGYTGGQVNTFYKYSTCTGITSTVVPTAASCGLGNGAADLTVAGTASPNSYVWSNGSTTEDITGLSQGAYSVTITDANGCTASNTTTVTMIAPPTATASVTNISCNGGNNGSATVNPSGGTAPFTYSWSNGATTQNISGVVAGNYTILIVDATGCSSQSTASITQPTALTVTATSTYLSCAGCGDGTATAITSGGTASYTYAWSPSGGNSSTATGLSAGNYTVCITDANGCTQCSSVAVIFNSSVVEYNSPSISVYPNPSNGEFKIQGLKTDSELIIYNCIGEAVYQTNLPRKQENVNATSLPYGIYFLKIKAEDKIFTKKIILTE